MESQAIDTLYALARAIVAMFEHKEDDDMHFYPFGKGRI